ncbi:TIGR00730 family Rossman fold protein [Rhodoferax aquaticus]|uniref:Cytokinin riboside 5'-monophosphate phosphoribohydrolase n=1 Tax=Rhodoferax aquaticus TaxID=2527691 RepID=A0A515EQ97_9BURK|nr:TIGR00730 family Rossman fold protein [Rhodoferax aquaticus]QDL54854.1 TIGR00730 family Rossman fold protein [Rhodoferax aquaticus]
MNKAAFSICVYCGSRPGDNPAFSAAARQVGEWIGKNNGQLVYGGGKGGLMGIVADAALDAGASVVGIIPKALVEKEWAHRDCTELHIVENMHERKHMMAERSDAFIALPGGIGTLEEFFEVWTWRQLGYHDKPIGLLNVANFYDGLLAFLSQTTDRQFLSDWQMGLVKTSNAPVDLLKDLVEAIVPSGRIQLDQI